MNHISLKDGGTSVAGTGLDSFWDTREECDRKSTLVGATFSVSLEDGKWRSPEAKATTTRHLNRYSELVEGSLD